MTMKRKSPVADNHPMCGCVVGPKKLIVKKAGPNQGKSYWSCRACNLFEWIHERPKNWLESFSAKRVKAETAGCHCKGGARRQQTQKEGKNKGRWFLSCRDCDFFEWDGPVVAEVQLAQPITAEVQLAVLPKSDYTITVPDEWDWNARYCAIYEPY